jgi:hypothetical protein
MWFQNIMSLLPIFRWPSSCVDGLKACLPTSNLDFKDELSCDIFIMRDTYNDNRHDIPMGVEPASGSTIQIQGHLPFLRNLQEPQKNLNAPGTKVLLPTLLDLTNEANYQIQIASCHWNVVIPINTSATNIIKSLETNVSQNVENLSSMAHRSENVTLPIIPLVTSFYLQVRRNSKCSSSTPSLGDTTSNSSLHKTQNCQHDKFGTLEQPMFELPLDFEPAFEIIQDILYFEGSSLHDNERQEQNPTTKATRSVEISDTSTLQSNVASNARSIVSEFSQPTIFKTDPFTIKHDTEPTAEPTLSQSSSLPSSVKYSQSDANDHVLQCSEEQFERFQTIYDQLKDERGKNDFRLTILFAMAFFIFGVEFYSTLGKMYKTWRVPFKKVVNHILRNLRYHGDDSSNFWRRDIIQGMVSATIILKMKTQRRKQRVEHMFQLFSRLHLLVRFRNKLLFELLSDLPKVCLYRLSLAKVAMRSKCEQTLVKRLSGGTVCVGLSHEEKGTKNNLEHPHDDNEKIIKGNQKSVVGSYSETSSTVIKQRKERHKTREDFKVNQKNKANNDTFDLNHSLKKAQLSGKSDPSFINCPSPAGDLKLIRTLTVERHIPSNPKTKVDSKLETFQMSVSESDQKGNPPLTSPTNENGNENQRTERRCQLDSMSQMNSDVTCCNKTNQLDVDRSGSSISQCSSSSNGSNEKSEREVQSLSIPDEESTSRFRVRTTKEQIMKKKDCFLVSPPSETNKSNSFVRNVAVYSPKDTPGDKDSKSALSSQPSVRAISHVSSPKDTGDCDSLSSKLHIDTETVIAEESIVSTHSNSDVVVYLPTEIDPCVREDLKSPLKENGASHQMLNNVSGRGEERVTSEPLKTNEEDEVSSAGNKEMKKNKALINALHSFQQNKESIERNATTPQCAMATLDKFKSPVITTSSEQNDISSHVSFTSAIKSTSNAITLLRKQREDEGGTKIRNPVVQSQRKNKSDNNFERDISPSSKLQQEFLNRLAMQKKQKVETKHLKKNKIGVSSKSPSKCKKNKVSQLVDKWSLNDEPIKIATENEITRNFHPQHVSNGTNFHSQDGSFSIELRSKVSTDKNISANGEHMTSSSSGIKGKRKIKFAPETEGGLSPHFLDNFIESK